MVNERVRKWVQETREAQGLPPTVEDAAFLAQLADDVIGGGSVAGNEENHAAAARDPAAGEETPPDLSLGKQRDVE